VPSRTNFYRNPNLSRPSSRPRKKYPIPLPSSHPTPPSIPFLPIQCHPIFPSPSSAPPTHPAVACIPSSRAQPLGWAPPVGSPRFAGAATLGRAPVAAAGSLLPWGGRCCRRTPAPQVRALLPPGSPLPGPGAAAAAAGPSPRPDRRSPAPQARAPRVSTVVP